MAVSTKLMTADELLMLPDDGKRYELIEGVLNEMSPPGTAHGLTAMRAGAILFNFVHQRDLGRFSLPKQGSYFPRIPIRSAPPMPHSLPPSGCRQAIFPSVICGWRPTSWLKSFPPRTPHPNCKARYVPGLTPGAGWCGSCTPPRGRSPFIDPGRMSKYSGKRIPWTAARSSTDSAPRCATCFVNLHPDLQKGAFTPWSKAPR